MDNTIFLQYYFDFHRSVGRCHTSICQTITIALSWHDWSSVHAVQGYTRQTPHLPYSLSVLKVDFAQPQSWFWHRRSEYSEHNIILQNHAHCDVFQDRWALCTQPMSCLCSLFTITDPIGQTLPQSTDFVSDLSKANPRPRRSAYRWWYSKFTIFRGHSHTQKSCTVRIGCRYWCRCRCRKWIWECTFQSKSQMFNVHSQPQRSCRTLACDLSLFAILNGDQHTWQCRICARPADSCAEQWPNVQEGLSASVAAESVLYPLTLWCIALNSTAMKAEQTVCDLCLERLPCEELLLCDDANWVIWGGSCGTFVVHTSGLWYSWCSWATDWRRLEKVLIESPIFVMSGSSFAKGTGNVSRRCMYGFACSCQSPWNGSVELGIDGVDLYERWVVSWAMGLKKSVTQ